MRLTLRTDDPAALRATLAPLLARLTGTAHALDDAAVAGLAVAPADAAHPPTRHLHVGLAAPSRAAVDAFHAAGLAAGWADDGAPGPRPQYVPDYYGGFLRDPAGNSVEAVHYAAVRRSGIVDHVWLRVPDAPALAALRARLLHPRDGAVARHGLQVGVDTPAHLLLRAPGGGSASWVPADAAHPPTTGADLSWEA